MSVSCHVAESVNSANPKRSKNQASLIALVYVNLLSYFVVFGFDFALPNPSVRAIHDLIFAHINPLIHLGAPS